MKAVYIFISVFYTFITSNEAIYSTLVNNYMDGKNVVLYLSKENLNIEKFTEISKIIVHHDNSYRLNLKQFEHYVTFIKNVSELSIENLNVTILFFQTEVNTMGNFLVVVNDEICEPKDIFVKFWENDMFKIVVICLENFENENFTIYTANAFSLENKCGKQFQKFNVSKELIFYKLSNTFCGCDFIVRHFTELMPIVSNPKRRNAGVAIRIIRIFENFLKFNVKFIEDDFNMEYLNGKQTRLEEQAVYSR